MPQCKKCQKTFPNIIVVNGEKKIVHKRRYCLDCNPFGSRIKTSLINKKDGLYKQCRKCELVKPVSAFHRLKQLGSYKSYCKDCLKGSSTQWCRTRKQRIVNYLGNQCMDCRQVFPYYVYDCHHLDADKKSFQVSLEKIKWESLVGELDKCVLLCSNCHRTRHFEEQERKSSCQ